MPSLVEFPVFVLLLVSEVEELSGSDLLPFVSAACVSGGFVDVLYWSSYEFEEVALVSETPMCSSTKQMIDAKRLRRQRLPKRPCRRSHWIIACERKGGTALHSCASWCG